ncbi:MAG TPA: hypothetical protein VK669_02200, partial [Candidatus Limnocylindrales bacterium]|nr:hypothetical protein [Candidatus Limnocylindrales bacterium]
MRGVLIFRRAAAVAAVLLALQTTLVRAANEPLHAPDIVMDQLDRLEPIDRVEDLPAPIREGKFGEAVDEWALAEPGGHWNATDLIMDKSPQRRLVIAGCSSIVCVVNYERGGRGYHLVLAAFVRK